MRLVLFMLLFIPPSLGAQTVQVRIGASQLFNSEGVGLTFYAPHSTNTLDIGAIGTQVVLGASSRRSFHGGDLTLGDRWFSDGGIVIPVRGISFERKHEDKHDRWILFTGSVGQAFSAPYFTAFWGAQFGIGGFYGREWQQRLRVESLAAVAGGKCSALQSAYWTTPKWQLSGSGGVLQNVLFVSGSANYRPTTYAGVSVGHHTLFYQGRRYIANSANGYLQTHGFDIHAAVFNGGGRGYRAQGESFGMGGSVSIFRATADYFITRGYAARVTGFLNEQFSRHWAVSQFVNWTRQGYSVNYGGNFNSNRVSVGLGYQTIFLPVAGKNPFRQVLAVQIGLQLPSLTAHVQTIRTPDGRTLIGGDGSHFFGHLAESGTVQHPLGKYAITGSCVDGAEKAVEGCAIRIDGLGYVFSNSHGTFEAHVKSTKAVAVKVLPEEFSATGKWKVVSAPWRAKPGESLKIVVERQ